VLSERQRLILQHIIDLHVETAAPVGSKALAARLPLGLSPASIRNTMMELEERGYLGHPHTSAGRVPTDLAYRTWVDEWLEPEPLAEADIERIEAALAASAGDLSELLDRAARLIGGACRQLGIVHSPGLGQSVLESIEFIRAGDQRVLVALRVRDGLVKTVLLDVITSLDATTLARTASRLNESLVGLTLDDIQATLVDRAKAWSFADEEIVTRLIALGPGLFHFGDASALYVRGTGEIAAQPEFQSPEKLRELLRLIEERPGLSPLLEARRARPGMNITIGHENPTGPLAVTSIVTLTWTDGPLTGTIGVIGPTRMPYPRIAGMLREVAGRLDRRRSA
jgi:heat-inducible transcriptional repressor